MLSMFWENKVKTTRPCLITMSSSPEGMPIERLSALLKNRSAYAKYDNRVYFVDQHSKPLILQTDDFTRLGTLFPLNVNVLQDASGEDLALIKHFTGHTMDLFLLFRARHTFDVEARDSGVKLILSQSHPCTKMQDIDASYTAMKDDAMHELDATGSVLQFTIMGTLLGKNINESFHNLEDADLFMQHHQLLPSTGSCCVM